MTPKFDTLVGLRKGWHNVIGWAMIGIIVIIGQGFMSFDTRLGDIKEAKAKNIIQDEQINELMDSKSANTVEHAVLFNEIKNINGGIVDIKSGQERQYELMLQFYKGK